MQTGCGTNVSPEARWEVEEERRATRRRIAQQLGIPRELEDRIVQFPGQGRRFTFRDNPFITDDTLTAGFVGLSVSVTGVLYYGEPPGGFVFAAPASEFHEVIIRDPHMFNPAMLERARIQVWYAEVCPPNSRICGIFRWRPATGAEFGLPAWKPGEIGRTDIDRVFHAFDVFDHHFLPSTRTRDHDYADVVEAAMRASKRLGIPIEKVKKKDVAEELDPFAKPNTRERQVHRIVGKDNGMTWADFRKDLIRRHLSTVSTS